MSKGRETIHLDLVRAAALKVRSNPEIVRGVNSAMKNFFDGIGIELNIHERKYLLLSLMFDGDPNKNQ